MKSQSEIPRKALVENIKTSNCITRAWTNGEYMDYENKWEVNLITIKAYYNPDGITNMLYMIEVANIPCMVEVANNFPVTMDLEIPSNIRVFGQ